MRVAVLGAGLQGACVALELAEVGIAVDLYDREDACLTQASAQNEGKIHLGYVFGNDRTLNTARLMIRGAAVFEPTLRRWLGTDLDRVPVSAPFHYVVHRDSLLAADEVGDHLAACHALAAGEFPAAAGYFGSDPHRAPQRLTDAERDAVFGTRTVAAAFRTAEIALDPEALSVLLRARLLAEPRITVHLGTEVRAVEPDGDRLRVRFDVGGGLASECYDHVVNCLWDGRLGVDATMGQRPDRPWLFRIKHYLRVCAPGQGAQIPSTTIVLGPFGDVVVHGDDLYLSWYPAGRQGISAELEPPPWPRVLDEFQAKELWHDVLGGLVGVVPALEDLTPSTVSSWSARGGIIFAWGSSDIDDPGSGLHQRSAIGPQSHGTYHSVDTGKLTMAPLFGAQVTDRIRATGRAR
ncbi:FAD-dependent oxidoreductase [Sporichthya sp.]|uniref:FAD-dependent oxidoreductase n=1 Tax=Sporichthya sp. TaxID=65475 RepID=UPI00182549F6|nr:FAD-dependent oxidoreductase [Sporichthya sp.]MBA3742431.1 FAD-binding oxidoreductase [Sporichthya sp.]